MSEPTTYSGARRPTRRRTVEGIIAEPGVIVCSLNEALALFDGSTE